MRFVSVPFLKRSNYEKKPKIEAKPRSKTQKLSFLEWQLFFLYQSRVLTNMDFSSLLVLLQCGRNNPCLEIAQAACRCQDFGGKKTSTEVALSLAGTRQLITEQTSSLSMAEMRDFARMKGVLPKRCRKQELTDLVVWTVCHFLSFHCLHGQISPSSLKKRMSACQKWGSPRPS